MPETTVSELTGPDRTAIVFMAHYLDSEVERRFRKLKQEAPDDCDVFLLGEAGLAVPEDLSERTCLFDFEAVRTMARSVIGDSLVPGNCHLRSIDFARRFPGYRFTWFVEYDVVYRDDWGAFFKSFDEDQSDLLAANVVAAGDYPDWYWTSTFSPAEELVGPEDRTIALLAIHRISAKGLEEVARSVAAGWVGHFEMLVPTALVRAGLTVADIGGSGPFTPAHRFERHYLDCRGFAIRCSVGTLRDTPAIRFPIIRDMLHHPCKTRPHRPDKLTVKRRREAFRRSPGALVLYWLRIARHAIRSHLWRVRRLPSPPGRGRA